MALKSLALRDFVIVRELDLSLASGFTVLTGETGAGKSILIDAVQLVLGARADAGEVEPERIVAALVAAGVGVRGFAVRRPSLEDLFVSLTGEGFDVGE